MTGSANTLGAAGPGSAVGDFNTLSFLIHQAIAQLHTTKLCKVVKAPYDRQGNPLAVGSASIIGFIDVQPLVNQMDGAGNPTPHGTVYRLSYHRYQSGTGSFITDPAVGDQGFMTVGDRDGSVARNTNDVANPGSSRVMDAADGIFLGSCQGSIAPKQYFSWLTDGWKIVDKHGNTFLSNGSGFSLTDLNGNKLISDSNGWHFTSTVVDNTGEITRGKGTGDQVTLGQHTHSDPQGGNTGPPNPGT